MYSEYWWPQMCPLWSLMVYNIWFGLWNSLMWAVKQSDFIDSNENFKFSYSFTAGFWATVQNGCHWSTVEGSHQDQFVPVHIGQRDLCLSGRQEQSHSLQKLQTNPLAAGLAWRQLQNTHGKANALSGLILGLRPTNERWRYIVTSSLIGWVQA